MAGGEGGGDLVGVVAEIVDDGDSGAGADDLETPPKPFEAAERLGRRAERNSGGAGGGESGEGVGDIVAARDLQGDGNALSVAPVGDREGDCERRFDDVGGPVIGRAVGEAEGDRARRSERRGFRIVEVDDGGAGFAEEVAEQLAQLLHRLVVEADVVEHGDLRPVEGDRAVALVDLADEDVAARRPGRWRRAHRRWRNSSSPRRSSPSDRARRGGGSSRSCR